MTLQANDLWNKLPEPTLRDRAADCAAEALLRLRAFGAVLTSDSGDLSETSLATLGWRAGCLAAILLGRRSFSHEGAPLSDPACPLHAVTMASFGHEKLYAGWREQVVTYHPNQFRFEIESDGDWNM